MLLLFSLFPRSGFLPEGVEAPLLLPSSCGTAGERGRGGKGTNRRGLPTFCKADFHPATTLVHAGLEVGVRRSTALQPCLAASSGCASGVGAFAGNRLQGAKRPKLGGRRSEARRGQSPKPLDASTQRTVFHLSRTFADGRRSRSCDPFETFRSRILFWEADIGRNQHS